MLCAGEYTLVQVLDIAVSLLAQLEASPSCSLTKCLLSDGKTQFIAYFVDKLQIGAGSVIEIPKSTRSPLLWKKDYSVIRPVKYKHEVELIKQLIRK